jgi:hypothetical protein
VQLPADIQALDSHDLASIRRRSENQAPVHPAAVKQDGAGPTLAMVATLLGARQSEALAQQIQQRHARINVIKLSIDAVDPQAKV